MRELKFRAWHEEQKRMFEVYGLGKYFVTENTLDGVDEGVNAFCGDDMNFIKVMQFTGLKDKNGLDVYEDDVVKGIGVTSYDKPIIRIVAFDDKSARFGLTDLTGDITFEPLKWISFPLEIIGNIHENPELLK